MEIDMSKMWKWAFLLLLAALAMGATTFIGANDRDYKTLRAISASDDTGPAAEDCNATAAQALIDADTAVRMRQGSRTNLIESRGITLITFSLTDATGEIANWSLYGIKQDGSPLEFVAHGTATAGATETDDGGNTFYANAITVTQESWNALVTVIDGYQWNLGTGAVANGGIAKLKIDSCEYKYLYMLMSKSTCATMGARVSSYF
jgi:hypothetical protein